MPSLVYSYAGILDAKVAVAGLNWNVGEIECPYVVDVNVAILLEPGCFSERYSTQSQVFGQNRFSPNGMQWMVERLVADQSYSYAVQPVG